MCYLTKTAFNIQIRLLGSWKFQNISCSCPQGHPVSQHSVSKWRLDGYTHVFWTKPQEQEYYVYVICHIQFPWLIFSYKLHLLDFCVWLSLRVIHKGIFIGKPGDSKTGLGPAHPHKHDLEDSFSFLLLSSKPNIVRGMYQFRSKLRFWIRIVLSSNPGPVTY